MRYTSALDIRGSDNRTSELVKRGGFLGSHCRTFARISLNVRRNIQLMLQIDGPVNLVETINIIYAVIQLFYGVIVEKVGIFFFRWS